jgi:ABC-type uncharacterized transport system involved in gliding motility auxiliary subunit
MEGPAVIRRPSVAAKHWALLAFQVFLVLALCAFVQALADRLNRRYDLTPLKIFALSEQSSAIAKGLVEPVRVSFFYDSREEGRRRQVADLLDQFTAASPMMTYRLYDLDRSPGLAKKYGVSNYNSGIMESRGKTHSMNGIDEVEVVSGLLKLTRDRPRILCFLTGHGEHTPMEIDERKGYSDVAKSLEREQFRIKTFDVAPSPSDLEQCTVVVLAGPAQNLFADETERLTRFILRGGSVLLMMEPDTPPSYDALIQRFGIRAGSDLVVDERNRLYGADSYMARVPIFDRDTFGKKMDTAAIFSVARTITPAEKAPEGIAVGLVALSSPDSWAQVDTTTPNEGKPEFRQDVDRPGPLPVAVMATVEKVMPNTDEKPGGRLVVFGDADFASNFYLSLLGNRDLFMSMIAVLAEDKELVAVRSPPGLPSGTLSPIYLTADQGRTIFWVAVVAVPGLAVLTGCAVVYRRRRRGF